MQIAQNDYEKRKRRNIKIGLLWLIAPTLTLVAVLSSYAIITFTMSQLSYDDYSTTVVTGDNTLLPTNNYDTASSMISVILSLIGIAALIGIMVGIPLGIIYLSKRVVSDGIKFDPRSGKGDSSEIPPEINHWNWGAAGLTWIWGASHRVWISFLAFIPLVNIFMIIYLGLNGNKLAWRADKWENVETFLAAERKWKPWGIFFIILNILAILSQFGNSSY